MHAIMRYRIRTSDLDTHLALLQAVYAELADVQPAGLDWTTYQLDDPTSFLEVVSGPDLPEPLPHLTTFQRYRAGLEDRCDEPPVFTETRQVGSYRSPCADATTD